jgi:metallopeptidase MepB
MKCFRYPDVLPVLKNCKNENTRRIHYIAYESRNKENIAILEEAVKLRRQAAKVWENSLLGCTN